jgi:hypothetical protein
MDDAADAVLPHEGRHGIGIGDVGANEGEARLVRQGGEPRLLQGGIIISIDAVDADDPLAPRQKAPGGGMADEAGRASDEDGRRLAHRPTAV